MNPASGADDLGMRRALAEAHRGLGAVEPNPMVGAVVVLEGELVGVGHHARYGGPHAEVGALAEAGESARGATLYVTLEPCCHRGKTPPCTEAILRAGIARVVAGARDPFPLVDGGGFARLLEEGIEVVRAGGLLAEEARALIAPFRKLTTTGRPFVTAKWAMTLDGKAAAASGASRWITGSGARALVHELRGRMDAILVGIGTALADDPELTARPPGPRVAARVVLDPKARLPLDGKLARTAREVPVIVVVTRAAPDERTSALAGLGCEVLPIDADGPVPIGPLLTELGARRMTNLLVEGGGVVLGSFLDAGEVDAVDAYIAPILEGGDHARTPARGRGVSEMAEALRLARVRVQAIDGDIRIQGRIPRPWDAPNA